MQLRMSPGGSTRFSRRSRPELPPSSVTVTIAARSTMGRRAVGYGSWRGTTCCFKPRSNAERPVPPPRATTRMPGTDERERRVFFTRMPEFARATSRQQELCEFTKILGDRQQHKYIVIRYNLIASVLFRLEQFGEAGIFLEESKILVVARVVTVGSAQFDGDFQIGQRGIGFTGEAIERSQSVHNVISFGCQLASFVQTFAGVIPAPEVHHGYAALIMLFKGARILFLRRLHALFRDFDVHTGAVGEFLAGAFDHFFQFLFRTFKFLLMEKTEHLVLNLLHRLTM